jgi:hypothetical protein
MSHISRKPLTKKMRTMLSGPQVPEENPFHTSAGIKYLFATGCSGPQVPLAHPFQIPRRRNPIPKKIMTQLTEMRIFSHNLRWVRFMSIFPR